jgi:hypothetical protein
LQTRETWDSFVIEHHDLTIDDAVVGGQRLHRARDLWKHTRVVIAVSREQQRFAA